MFSEKKLIVFTKSTTMQNSKISVNDKKHSKNEVDNDDVVEVNEDYITVDKDDDDSEPNDPKKEDLQNTEFLDDDDDDDLDDL